MIKYCQEEFYSSLIFPRSIETKIFSKIIYFVLKKEHLHKVLQPQSKLQNPQKKLYFFFAVFYFFSYYSFVEDEKSLRDNLRQSYNRNFVFKKILYCPKIVDGALPQTVHCKSSSSQMK
jgi:hypothetical protein